MNIHSMMANHTSLLSRPGFCVLALGTVVLLAGVRGVDSSEDNPCRRGIKLFALRESPEGHTLKSPTGRVLPVKKEPVLVLRMSDIQEVISVPASDTYVPELRSHLQASESLTVVLSGKGTRKLAALVRSGKYLPVLYASCDSQVAAGTVTYPLNFDDVVAREGRGYLFIDNDIDPKTTPSPRP